MKHWAVTQNDCVRITWDCGVFLCCPVPSWHCVRAPLLHLRPSSRLHSVAGNFLLSASGHSGNIPWPDYFHRHVWEQSVQSDHRRHFRNHLGVRRRPSAPAAGSGPESLVISTRHSVPLLSTARIPLWRWQRMLLYLLGNVICCIVATVLLNVADHRQVAHLAGQWFYHVNATKVMFISIFSS